MTLLGQTIEAVLGGERDPFKEIDLQPALRVQLTRAAIQLLTPKVDLFDWFWWRSIRTTAIVVTRRSDNRRDRTYRITSRSSTYCSDCRKTPGSRTWS